jgi:hypothetical protein
VRQSRSFSARTCGDLVDRSGQGCPLYIQLFQSGYNRGNIVTARLQYPCETKHICG